MPIKIDINPTILTEFCRKWHIRRLWLFGSVLRDDFQPDSDVDVLYEFEEGWTPGLAIVRAADELSQAFGRKVDMVSNKFLHPFIRRHSSFRQELIYEQVLYPKECAFICRCK